MKEDQGEEYFSLSKVDAVWGCDKAVILICVHEARLKKLSSSLWVVAGSSQVGGSYYVRGISYVNVLFHRSLILSIFIFA